ncbi:MAG: RNA polymerase factor sigma-54 [Phycisphaerae bacterium]|nr:RNA polymerase factor sigma-54 [Phycisphaerae bacterium]
MRLDTSQQLRLGQEMKMAPRIIQAMEILQLPMLGLQERIDAELVSNPVLELQEGRADEPAEQVEAAAFDDRGESDMVITDGGDNAEDFNRLDEMTVEYGPEYIGESAPAPSRGSYDDQPDRKLEAMANTAAPAESLTEYLLKQWMFVDVSEATAAAGRLIINYIEADGYLRMSLDELSAKTAEAGEPQVDRQTLRDALEGVQGLDPVGVGARDLKECLLIQLNAEAVAGKDVALEKQIVTHFLREVEMNRLPVIAKRTGYSIEQIKAGIESLSHLDPHPGLLIGQSSAPIITPDVIVTIDDDGSVVVTMADGSIPGLTISDFYRKQARDRQTEKSARQFLQKNIRSAQWLIEAIAQRRHTICRVTEEIFKAQRDFLDYGPEALKPLPMADVAGKVGVHVATVSRAVSDKYAQTPRGIFPLRMFFSGGTTTASGEDMSWDAVKAKLREIVDNEDKSKPLNDDRLAEELNSHGIDIARRTVAKYRGMMNIPPARKRREY